jgi:hypothetical protein
MPAPVRHVRAWLGLAALAACAAFFFHNAQALYAEIDSAQQQVIAASLAAEQPETGR